MVATERSCCSQERPASRWCVVQPRMQKIYERSPSDRETTQTVRAMF